MNRDEPLIVTGLETLAHKNLLRDIYMRDNPVFVTDVSASNCTHVDAPRENVTVSNTNLNEMVFAASPDQRTDAERREQNEKRKRARAERNRLRKHRARGR